MPLPSSASRPRSSPPTGWPVRAARQGAAGQPLRRLGAVIDNTEKLTGCTIERAYVDKGYRGHDTANPRRVFISGQKRGVFGVIKRELRRRSAIEAVIGHLKTDGHLGRCYLKGRDGDAANVILSAVGHNLRLVLAWLRIWSETILWIAGRRNPIPQRRSDLFTGKGIDVHPVRIVADTIVGFERLKRYTRLPLLLVA